VKDGLPFIPATVKKEKEKQILDGPFCPFQGNGDLNTGILTILFVAPSLRVLRYQYFF
jgi:hypothetical protein